MPDYCAPTQGYSRNKKSGPHPSFGGLRPAAQKVLLKPTRSSIEFDFMCGTAHLFVHNSKQHPSDANTFTRDSGWRWSAAVELQLPGLP